MKIASKPGTNGSRVMTADHTDVDGRVWPKGTAYRPASTGSTPHGDRQTIVIESSHYQTVLTEGFGETATFAA